MNWNLLEDVADFEKLSQQGSLSTYAIFKHSTRCPISSAAKNRVEATWEQENPTTAIYYLDLLAHRDISNLIAERLGVIHQSPQLIVVKNGEVVYQASHVAINPSKVAEILST